MPMPDWAEILSRDGPAAWRAAYRIVGNRADADECFQEACLAALNISRRQNVRQWSALLRRLAAARAMDRLRQRQRRRAREQVADIGSLAGGDPPSQRMEGQESADRLRTVLAKIPSQQAELFCLHCLEDWSYQEIADELGISTSRVGVLIHRARSKLAKLLAAARPRVASSQKEST
jgi:RNA polymerase sigma-70 factor (ECF subfamily)